MAVTVAMPQLGETVTEGTILSWAKQVGDTVAEDEVLLEISTDKVDTEVPSPASGVIREILVGAGETVTVGTPLAVIADPGEVGEAPAPTSAAPAAEAPMAQPETSQPEMAQPEMAQPETAQTPIAQSPMAGAAPPPPPGQQPAPPPSGQQPAPEVTEPAPAAAPQPVAAAPASSPPQPAPPPSDTAPAAATDGVTVTMPQLGETVTEGTILSWAKQVGDTVAEDEVLLEISTDKVDTEVPSPASGVIQEILVGAGETVTVGTRLAVIAPAGAAPAPAPSEPPVREAVPASAPPAEEPAPTAPAPEVRFDVERQPAEVTSPAAAAVAPAAGLLDGPRRGILSPVVRRLATEHGIDLTHVPGTGDGGRITRKDVMAYIEGGGPKVSFEPAEAGVAVVTEAPPTPAAAPAAAAPQPTPPPAAVEPQPAPVAAAPQPAPAAAPAPAPAAAAEPARAVPEGDQVVQLSRLRTRIAENMINAKRTAAHVWASVEVDYERVERVRQAHKEEFKAREGFSLTYLPFVARAVIDALEEFPVVNSSFRLDEGTQTFHSRVNLGIAVDMNQKGLVVVSVKEADGLRLAGLARAIRQKAQKARDGNLEPDDISGSTFSITNPGPYGSFMTAPIINVPNVAILSTDTVTKRAVVVTDEFGHDSIAIRHIGYLGLTWDHRAFDGSTAVLFLNRVKENIQTWDWEQELA